MKRTHSFRLGLLASLAIMFAACSTSRDAFLNRTFHRLVTRDNGWFNANEKLKEDIAAMEKAYVDDYDEVLPIFIYGSDEQSKAMIPDMEKCIEKCATVIHRHSMDIGSHERNSWIDDAYFVIAKCHFYKRTYFDADRTFAFIGRRFKGQNRQIESKVWYARTAIQQEEYSKAQSALDEVKNEKKLPKHFPHAEFSAVQADLNLKRGKIDDAIVDLEHAVEISKTKKQRVRWMFILAQLYQVKGDQDKAIAMFLKVAHSNPPYELGFHAEVAQALAFDRGNSKDIRKKLHRMLRDEKNKDHFDLIHYAIADLDLKENLDSAAVVELKVSASVSTNDTKQKAKSFLKLADIFFDDKKYPPAQQYYDSTLALIPEKHKRYDEVKTRAEVLGELVQQLDIIAHEDSLQEFAKLPKEEQEKRVKKLIKERERAEDEKAAAEAEAREVVANNPKPGGGGGAGATSDQSAWYFYNSNTISRGSSEFKKKWGPRTNDDDWRRKDKSGSANATVAEDVQDTTSDTKADAGKDGEPAWKDPANYLKGLPNDSASMDASNVKVCEAMYLCGMIYKEKLKDIDAAIESFQVLNNRFDECHYTPESYYQLYRIFLKKEQTGSYFGDETSQQYADTIMKRWPDSEFARLVRDPNQIQKDVAAQQMEDSLYTEVYHQFRSGYIMPVIAACNTVITEQPKNHLLPKYALLKAMAVGGMHEIGAFRTALTEVMTTYPGSDEAKAAQAILAALDKQAGGSQQSVKGPHEEMKASYKTDAGTHFFVLMFPSADGDIQPVKTKISNFNEEYFHNSTISVENLMLDNDNQVITIKVFETKDKAMEYYSLFLANKDILTGVNDQGYAAFAISPSNYAEFYKNKDVDGYSNFFAKNYLPGQ